MILKINKKVFSLSYYVQQTFKNFSAVELISDIPIHGNSKDPSFLLKTLAKQILKITAPNAYRQRNFIEKISLASRFTDLRSKIHQNKELSGEEQDYYDVIFILKF